MINKNGKIIVPSQFAAKQRALNAAKEQAELRKVPKHLRQANVVPFLEDASKTSQDALQGPCDSKGDTTPSQPIKLPFIVQIQPLTLRDRICLSASWIFKSIRAIFSGLPRYALFHVPNPNHSNPIKEPVLHRILSKREYRDLQKSTNSVKITHGPEASENQKP